MKKRMQAIFVAVAIFCMFVSVLAYTRPLTIEQRYPVLDLSQCTLIRGYFNDGTSVEVQNFTIAPDDPHFDEMIKRSCEIFYPREQELTYVQMVTLNGS